MMKTRALNRIQTGIVGVVLICVVAFFLTTNIISNGETAWGDRQWAEQQIGEAQTVEQLQGVAHRAVSSIAFSQRLWGITLRVFAVGSIANALFLSWILFTIKRAASTKDTKDDA